MIGLFEKIFFTFTKVVAFAVFLNSLYGFSNIPKSCIETIRDFNKRAKQTYISYVAQLEIQKIFSKEKNSSVCAKKLFDIVLRERLSGLSLEIQKQVDQLLKKRTISNKEALLTIYNEATDTIYLHNDFPEIEPNYIYYASYIHEIEHALQSYLLKEKFPNVTTNQIDTVALRTQQEIGAMLLEYDYIRNVPEMEKKKALFEAVNNESTKTTEAEKKYFRTLLSGTYTKPIEYIKANQKNGRYTVESIENFFESFGH